MKIFQLITRSDTIGGAQKHVIDLSVALSKQGNKVEVISSGEGLLKQRLLIDSNIRYHNLHSMHRSVNFLSDLKSLIELRRLVLNNNPCVLATHSVKAGLLGRLACFGTNTKSLFTAHGWSHIRSARGIKKNIYILLERLLSLLSSRIICVSKADLNYASQFIKIDKSKLIYIPNGSCSPKMINSSKAKDNVLRLLSVVRFQAPKDFDTLFLGLNDFKNISWHLHLLGDGEDIEHVRYLINKYNLIDKVTIEGFRDNLNVYYNSADLVLLISKSEGLPMSLIEAMSYGKPLIASNVGGISELLEHGSNGYLIETSDFKNLTLALNKLSSPIKRKVMGERSREIYLKNYSFDSMLSKTINIYDKVIVSK